MKIARVILFTAQIDAMSKFYGEVLGLKQITLREKLVARGANFRKVRQGEVFCLCDGKDPDGNPLQLSDR
ncbi:MAG TPA: hypothetical protein VHY84_05540 [Bryobacteraceae bacterium]|jgi:hypothetical protein|nr:hypothetical protein [Bryobacteraceae bacterium]